MEITKKALEERLNRLEADLEQTLANAHALEGAIQDCKYWLEQLDDSQKEASNGDG